MRRLFVLIVGVALSAPLPVAAQQDAPPSMEVARLMQGLASCIGASQPAMVDDMLALPLMSQEQNLFIAQSLGSEQECMRQLPTTLRFQPPALVGGLAEEMFLSRHAEQDTKWIVAHNAAAKPRNEPEDLALCIVGRNPGVTRALLDTIPSSDEERMLATKLAPALGSCLPTGMTLSFAPSNVRTFAAMGLYLSARAAPGQQAAARP